MSVSEKVSNQSSDSISRTRGGLSLRENFSWSLLGNITYAASQWGVLIVLAKLTSPEMVGQFALGLAVTGPIMMLGNLQLRGVQATDAKNEYLFGHYLSLRLVSTFLSLLIIAAIAYWGGYSTFAGLVILVVGLSKFVESISDVFYGFMQRHERMDFIARSMIIKGLSSLCVVAIVVYMSGDVLWGVVGLTLTWVLVLIAYDLPSAALIGKWARVGPQSLAINSELMPIFDRGALLRLALLAFPLGVVAGLLSLTANIPRYFIENYLGERSLGIFAALAYLVVAGSTVVGAMGQSAVPKLSNYYAKGDISRFQNLLWRLVVMGALLGTAGVVLALIGGRPLLSLLYGDEYSSYVDVFAWLMAYGAATYMSSFLGYGITSARYFRIQVPVNTVVLLVNVLACWFLVPNYGLLGAVCAVTIGAISKLIFNFVVIFKKTS